MMKQVILQVKDGKYKFFMELIRSLDFVQVEENREDTKEEVLANLKHRPLQIPPQYAAIDFTFRNSTSDRDGSKYDPSITSSANPPSYVSSTNSHFWCLLWSGS